MPSSQHKNQELKNYMYFFKMYIYDAGQNLRFHMKLLQNESLILIKLTLVNRPQNKCVKVSLPLFFFLLSMEYTLFNIVSNLILLQVVNVLHT